jgi:hypothetical protein
MTYEYPLSWPPGFPRSKYPAQSRFDTPEERVKRNLEFQLDLMDASNVVVTTNVELRRDGRPYANQRISDTGVAVSSHAKAVSRPLPATSGTRSATTSKRWPRPSRRYEE